MRVGNPQHSTAIIYWITSHNNGVRASGTGWLGVTRLSDWSLVTVQQNTKSSGPGVNLNRIDVTIDTTVKLHSGDIGSH